MDISSISSMLTPDKIPLYIGIFVAAVVVSLLVAFFRNALVALIGFLLELIAKPFTALARAFRQGISVLKETSNGTLRALEHSSGHGSSRTTESGWQGWVIISSLIYSSLFLFFSLSDFWISLLTFRAMGYGFAELPALPFSLDILLGLTWVCLAAFWGLFLFDLFRHTSEERPWGDLGPTFSKALKITSLGAFLCTIFAGIGFGVWRQLQLGKTPPPEPLNSAIPVVLMGLLFALLLLAAAAAMEPFRRGLASVYAMILIIINILLYVALALLQIVVMILNAVAAVLVAAVDVLASLGRMLWNWFCSFGIAEVIHIEAIAEPIDRPVIGADITTPLV